MSFHCAFWGKEHSRWSKTAAFYLDLWDSSLLAWGSSSSTPCSGHKSILPLFLNKCGWTAFSHVFTVIGVREYQATLHSWLEAQTRSKKGSFWPDQPLPSSTVKPSPWPFLLILSQSLTGWDLETNFPEVNVSDRVSEARCNHPWFAAKEKGSLLTLTNENFLQSHVLNLN